jgi:hypothetical protein
MANKIKSFKSNRQIGFDASGIPQIPMATGEYFLLGDKRVYFFTTAITANSTTTSAPAGSLAVTTHATGLASIFVSDASKWQFLTNA